jgi:hypothetical protein
LDDRQGECAYPALVLPLAHDARLQGQPADDGLPLVPGELQLGWSKFTGPGDVQFANSNAPVTTASFAAPGVYGLRLTASDGALNASGFVNVYVLAETYASWTGTYFSPAEMNDPSVSGPQADADNDAFTNEQEFTANTNPRDASSHLRVENAEAAAGTNRIRFSFTAAARRTYSVQYRDDLVGVWKKLSDVSFETTNRRIEIQDAAPTHSLRYYRIVTPTQP